MRYPVATKNARLQAVVSQIGRDGRIELLSSDGRSLAVIRLSDKVGSISGGVLTFDTRPEQAIADGKVAKARIKSGAGLVIIDDLTVGPTGEIDITPSLELQVGQVVTTQNAVIVHG